MSSKPRPNAGPSRREQLRLQQLEAAKRAKRNRVIVIVAAVVAVVLIAGAVWWGVASSHKNSGDSVVAGAQVTPPNAVGTDGILVTSDGAKTPAADAPTLIEYQDYQCPGCKAYYDAFGKPLDQLVTDGKIKLEYRTMTFLDTNEHNTASSRAAYAAACADIVGRFEAYHDVVYANQPAVEGTGYTDQQLRVDFAQKAGITGSALTKFQSCYDQRATKDFVTAVAQKAMDAGINSTPTFKVIQGSKTVTLDLSKADPTEDGVMAAITKALA